MRGIGSFMAGLLVLWLASACASKVTRQDLDRQAEKIRSGDEQALDSLYEKRGKVKEPEKEKYVEVIGDSPAEKSSDILRSLYDDPNYQKQKRPILDSLARHPDERNAEFIRTKLQESPGLYSDQMEAYLIQRADRPSAEAILQLVQQGNAPLNPRNIAFFGQVGLSAALPVLAAHADKGNDVVPVMDAVARFGTPEAGDYLVRTAKTAEHPGRIAAIRRLSSAQNQTEARTFLHSVIETSARSDELIAALECLREMGFNEDTYNLIRGLYYKTQDATVQTAALETMATLRQVDSTDLAKELEGKRKSYVDLSRRSTTPGTDKKEPGSHTQTSLTRAYQNTSRLKEIIQSPRQARSEPSPSPTTTRERPRAPRTMYRNDETEAGSSRYDRRLGRSFDRLFGDESSSVRTKVHNALLTYADSDSSAAQFVQRAYQKGFGVDEQKTKELLKKGLHAPNSLETVLSAVVSEYGRRDLQVYALSSFFAIKRKQAERLLDAYRRRAL